MFPEQAARYNESFARVTQRVSKQQITSGSAYLYPLNTASTGIRCNGVTYSASVLVRPQPSSYYGGQVLAFKNGTALVDASVYLCTASDGSGSGGENCAGTGTTATEVRIK